MKRLIGLSVMVVLAASLCWAQGGYFDAALSQQEEKANQKREFRAALTSALESLSGDSTWRVEVAKYKNGHPCVSVDKGNVEIVLHAWFDVDDYQAKINRLMPLLEKAGRKSVHNEQIRHYGGKDLVVWEVNHDDPDPQEFKEWLFSFNEKTANSLWKMFEAAKVDETYCTICFPICLDKEGNVLWHPDRGLRLDARTLAGDGSQGIPPAIVPGGLGVKQWLWGDAARKSYHYVSKNEFFRSVAFPIPKNVLQSTAEVRCVLLYSNDNEAWNDGVAGKVPPVDELCQGQPPVVDATELKAMLLGKIEKKAQDKLQAERDRKRARKEYEERAFGPKPTVQPGEVEYGRVSTTEVSGDSLFAQALTRREQASDAAAILDEDLSDLRTKFVTAELAKDAQGSPAVGVGDDGLAFVVIRVSVDNTAYKSWVDQVIPKLEKIATKKTQMTLNPFEPGRGGALSGADWPLVIQTAQSDDGSQAQVAGFALDGMLKEKLGGFNGRKGLLAAGDADALLCDVQLLDASGLLISSVKFMISETPILSQYTEGGFTIAPHLKVQRTHLSLLALDQTMRKGRDPRGYSDDFNRLFAGSQEWFYGLSLRAVPAAALGRVAKVECRVSTGNAIYAGQYTCRFFRPDSKAYLGESASAQATAPLGKAALSAPHHNGDRPNVPAPSSSGTHYNGDRPNVPAPGSSSERTGGIGAAGIGAAVDSVSDGISGAIDSVKSLFW